MVPQRNKFIFLKPGLLQQCLTIAQTLNLITSQNFTRGKVNRALINIKTKFTHHKVWNFKAKRPMRGKR